MKKVRGYCIGDRVKLIGTEFKVTVEGFKKVNGFDMIETKYGDFNVDLIEKI